MEKCEKEGFPYGSWLRAGQHGNNGGLLLKPKPSPGRPAEPPQTTAVEFNSGERREARDSFFFFLIRRSSGFLFNCNVQESSRG